jgi:hypothetical protein
MEKITVGFCYLSIVGLCMVGFGIRLMFQRIRFLLKSRVAWGEISGSKESPEINRREVYSYNEVVFTADDGLEHRAAADTGTVAYPWQKTSIKVGRTVPVRYDPANPDEAHIGSLFNLWAPSISFLAMGAGALFAAFHQIK